jgi:hypothetical protein
VKVRGFRIELGEIEATLSNHESVASAVVLAREVGPGDARLGAWVVLHPGESPTVTELRRHLRTSLPEFMIPSQIVTVGAIPLTPAGKVDRAALPDPFRSVRVIPSAPLADGPERDLAAIWQEILGLESVAPDDNFFDIGGHSLLALRVARAVEARMSTRMDPRALFFQTLRQIASSLRR